VTFADAPSIATALTGLAGIRHPVLLAPMGDAAGGRLATAVSAAGGLGMLGGGYADPVWLERELAVAAGARIGVGFITFALERRPEALRLALDAGPVAVQLSFGDPRPHADAIHAAGSLLFCQAQRSDEIAAAVDAGADVIIAQGRDAGGHGRPDRGTIGLVPSVVDRVAPLPVVAAGGIADGRGLAAALALGAAGVTVGTRLLASVEAISNAAEAALLVAKGAEDTVRTSAFDVIRGPAWPSGHDGRALRNDLTGRYATGDADAHEELRERYRRAGPQDYDLRPVWAGEGLDAIDAIAPAGAIVADLVAGAVRAIEEAGRLAGLLNDPQR